MPTTPFGLCFLKPNDKRLVGASVPAFCEHALPNRTNSTSFISRNRIRNSSRLPESSASSNRMVELLAAGFTGYKEPKAKLLVIHPVVMMAPTSHFLLLPPVAALSVNSSLFWQRQLWPPLCWWLRRLPVGLRRIRR